MISRDNILTLSKLGLAYDRSNPLLVDINASMGKGEMLALVGPNGSGKSTLLRTISRLLPIVEGKINLFDKKLEEFKQQEFARRLSFVGTNTAMVENYSVFELVSIGRHPYTNWWGGLRKRDEKKIEEALSFVGMSRFINARVNTLSDGERQRVMIAIALAQDTDLIILDEPTAFLDVPNRIAIAEVLHKLSLSGKSVLFSTHDFDSVFNYSTKIWAISGKKLKEGAPEDLGIEGVYDHIFNDNSIVFDLQSSKFRRKSDFIGEITLDISEENISRWTSMALSRAGVKCMNKKDASGPLLKFEDTEKGKCWILFSNNERLEFKSLYSLNAYLTEKR